MVSREATETATAAAAVAAAAAVSAAAAAIKALATARPTRALPDAAQWGDRTPHHSAHDGAFVGIADWHCSSDVFCCMDLCWRYIALVHLLPVHESGFLLIEFLC